LSSHRRQGLAAGIEGAVMAVPVRFLSPRSRRVTPARLILIGLILLNLIYLGMFATRRYLAFETSAFDLGVYVQPLWNFIQGRNFALSLVADNGPLRWATHVEPILFLLVPLYKLWPDPRTLLWVQVTALSLAALPLFALAARRLQNEWIAVIIVLAYFLLPATQAVALFDFHAVALAPLFILGAVYFLDQALAVQGVSFWWWPGAESGERRAMSGERGARSGAVVGQVANLSFRWWPGAGSKERGARSGAVVGQVANLSLSAWQAYLWSGLFFLLALSTKEDISLHVFLIGLYLLLLRRRWWEGGSLIVVGLVWFYVAFQLVIPAFRTGSGQSIYVAWFESLGSTPLEIALSPIHSPDKVFNFLFQPDRLPPLGMLTIPLALLPVAGWPFLMMAAPSLGFSLLSQNPTLRQLETWHYAAPMLPFVMLATIDGLARLSYLVARLRAYILRSPPHPTRFYAGSVISGLISIILLMTTLTYHYFRGYSPLSQLPEWPEVTAHHQLGRELAAMIPPEASVLAQAELVPYVAQRRDLHIWSGPLYTDYEYIWLDLSHPKLPNRFNAHGEFLTGMVIEDAFGPIVAKDGYLILKRGAARKPIPEELFTFTEFDQIPAGAQHFDANFGDSLKLVAVKPDVSRLATSETEPQVILFFEVLQKPAEDYHLFVYLLDQTGTITGATDYPQPAIFWWPMSRWEPGDRRQVRVNTMPWWTGDNTPWSSGAQSVFAYAVGITRSDSPWDVSARLTVTLPDPSANPPGSQPVDSETLLPVAAFQRRAGVPVPRPLTLLERSDGAGQMTDSRVAQ
jgi:uncharacterized membrane protein